MFDFLKRQAAAPDEVKASAAGRVAAWGIAGRPVWGARDTGTLIRQGFAGNPVGFRVVKLISEAAAALPLVLSDGEKRFETHPLLSLIDRPNGAQGRAELLEALYGQLLLTATPMSRPWARGSRWSCMCCGPNGCGWCRGPMAGRLLMTIPWGRGPIASWWRTGFRPSAT